jgi:hypothetical protein
MNKPIQARGKFVQPIVTTLLVLTVFLIYAPLNPQMPNIGVDASWHFGMNVAQANHLVFGKEIVFTFGPYAGIFTEVYNPNTDSLILFGSTFLALFVAFVLIQLTKSWPVKWQLFLIYLLAIRICMPDTELFLYPMLISLFVYKISVDKAAYTNVTLQKELLYMALFLPFGLLLLIKGSLLVLITGVTILSAGVFWYKGLKRTAIGVCVAPLVSAVLFQLIAQQPLSALWDYFKNMLPIISGYNDAMTTPGEVMECQLFVIVSIVVMVFIYRNKNIQLVFRLFLMLTLALFLFTAFKAGFVRQDDSHAPFAASSIFIMAFLLFQLLPSKKYYISLGAAAIVCLYIYKNYAEKGAVEKLKFIPTLYTDALEGLALRKGNGLEDKYEDQLQTLRNRRSKVPLLPGTTDIYSFDQTYLLVSDNTWSPRPILQSYSAYTPLLAQINEAHLTGDRAPNNIIFKVQPIDNRLPALEDGLSWPTIINNYQPTLVDGDGFLYLKQKRAHGITPVKQEVYKLDGALGDEIIMPDTKQLLFAEFDINKRFLGIPYAALYRPDVMEIEITMVNGSTGRYRFVPAMGKAGFILSPFVPDTQTFSYLFGNIDKLNNNYIRSFKLIIPEEFDGGIFDTWSQNYTVRLYKIVYN